MEQLDAIFSQLKLTGGLFARCQYRGAWGLDMLSADARMLFHIVQSGSAEFQYFDAGKTAGSLTLTPGELVLLPFGHRHRLWQGEPPDADALPETLGEADFGHFKRVLPAAGDDDCTTLLCGYYRGGVNQLARHPLLKRLPPLIHLRAGRETESITRLIQLIDAESACLAAGSTLILDRLTEALLLYLLRAWTGQQEQPSGLLAALADPQLSRVLAALHERPAHHWTVAGLAKLAGASRARFCQRFQTVLGCGPFQYLTELRMSLAMDWLRNDKLSLAAVAEAVGYSSEAAFARVFKKQLGTTPGRFRVGGDGL